MKKILLLTLPLLLFNADLLSGQFTTRQAGMRIGYTSGIYYQACTETGNADTGFNAMLSFRSNGIQFTGLKIFYENSFSSISPNLYFGWGYGGHAGFIYSNHLKAMGEDYHFPDDRFCPLIGIDGWLAAEYRIEDIPIIVSLNLKPYMEITIPAFIRIMPVDFGVSVAYIF